MTASGVTWVDSHAHLDDARFTGDFDAVLKRASDAGIERIIAVATTAASSASCVNLANARPLLQATVGLHPNNLASEPPGAWDAVIGLAAEPVVVALGETGLDRHWHDTPFEMQEEYFARHLALSRVTKLPVVIHCREADVDMLRMLRDAFDARGPIKGVMHSFCGSAEMLEACIQMGLFISFAGMLTYKNADALRQTASKAPLDRVLVETDCPYLAPVPHRGKRNEPAHVVHTARQLAESLGISFDELAKTTTANAHRLFHRESLR